MGSPEFIQNQTFIALSGSTNESGIIYAGLYLSTARILQENKTETIQKINELGNIPSSYEQIPLFLGSNSIKMIKVKPNEKLLFKFSIQKNKNYDFWI